MSHNPGLVKTKTKDSKAGVVGTLPTPFRNSQKGRSSPTDPNSAFASDIAVEDEEMHDHNSSEGPNAIEAALLRQQQSESARIHVAGTILAKFGGDPDQVSALADCFSLMHSEGADRVNSRVDSLEEKVDSMANSHLALAERFFKNGR